MTLSEDDTAEFGREEAECAENANLQRDSTHGEARNGRESRAVAETARLVGCARKAAARRLILPRALYDPTSSLTHSHWH